MTWNHRVMRHPDVGGGFYVAIHEVHYNDKGEPVAYTENPITVTAAGMTGLDWQLKAMLKCLALPILTPADFPLHAEESSEPKA